MSNSKYLEVNPENEGDVLKFGGEGLRSCYQCGRCTGICPWIKVENKKFSPRKLVHFAQLGFENLFSEEDLWLCTTCDECAAYCPKEVDPPEVIKSIRSVSCERGEVPRGLSDALNNLYELGNPWGRGIRKRAKWAEGLNVEEYDDQDVLLWVGCLGAYDDRNIKSARALARVLENIETSWGTLGADERCCGDSALQSGELMVFEELMDRNMKVIKRSKASKIVTISPHCYNTLKNEYPEISDLGVEVLHYTQYLDELSSDLNLGKFESTVTYQDPCYLGRLNEVYEAPRNLLERIPELELVEMKNSRDSGICCGGGGGRFWLETEPEERLSNMRLEEALAVGADVLATACPFCLVNFEDSAKYLNVENEMKVLDISEIVLNSLENDGDD